MLQQPQKTPVRSQLTLEGENPLTPIFENFSSAFNSLQGSGGPCSPTQGTPRLRAIHRLYKNTDNLFEFSSCPFEDRGDP